jgi:hypothetical protein
VALNVTDAAAIPQLSDLYLFRRAEPGDQPPREAGAALLALVARKQLPGFAMAFYEPLSAAGRDHPPPARLALVADDAILLAPKLTATGWAGFLIAEDTAAGQDREFKAAEDPEATWMLSVPAPESWAAVWAEEAASLATPQSPHTPDSPSPPPG